MEDQSKVTINSILVDGQSYKVGPKLENESNVSITYTRRGDDGRMRHITLDGNVDDHRVVIVNSITDTETGKTYEFRRGEACFSELALYDKAGLAKTIVARQFDDWLDHHEVKWSDVDFPSDHLSVKRLRTMFPRQFDKGEIAEGFGDFFYPAGIRECPHLVELQELLNHERTVTDYAFRTTIYPDRVRDDEYQACLAESRKALETLYQEFKLADSPETARLLIRGLEEEGAQQGKQIGSRARS